MPAKKKITKVNLVDKVEKNIEREEISDNEKEAEVSKLSIEKLVTSSIILMYSLCGIMIGFGIGWLLTHFGLN